MNYLPHLLARQAGTISLLLASALLFTGSSADAQMTFTGNIPADFGPTSLLATQTRPTGFGDSKDGSHGSEMNQLFARADEDNLYIGITGNVQPSFDDNGDKHGIIILLDTATSNTTPMTFPNQDRLKAFIDATFDGGFAPKFVIDSNNYQNTLYCDLYSSSGHVAYLGGGQDGQGTGAGDSNGGYVRFNNSNTTGVGPTTQANGGDGEPGVGKVEGAPAATTGMEVCIPRSIIGSPGGKIGIMAMIVSKSGYGSNQTLPGLPDVFGNLGQRTDSYHFSFDTYTGAQFATLDLAVSSTDQALNTQKWGYAPVYLTGTNAVDAHPPITSIPTVTPPGLGDLTYVAGWNGTNGVLFALRNHDLQNVTPTVAWANDDLDGAVTGRVVYKNIGGVARVYAQTDKGTVYMLDAETGENERFYKPTGATGSTTAATPAVLELDGYPTIFATVKHGTDDFRVAKFQDTAGTVRELISDPLTATDLSAPSIVAGGAQLQVGATKPGGTGEVFTLDTATLTPHHSTPTPGAVTAPPVLSLDAPTPLFFVGDSLGNFQAFNVSNAALVWDDSVAGGVSQSAFVDYLASPNIIYLATDTGSVYAKTVADGSPVAGYPTTPLGGANVTGAVTLLKPDRLSTSGNLYVPTDQGLFFLSTAAPTTATRYPLSGVTTTPSAGGAAVGSVIAVTSGNGAPVPGGVAGTNPSGFKGGNVYGLAVQ